MPGNQSHLKVRHHGVHQLFAERRVGFKRAADRTEGQEGPANAHAVTTHLSSRSHTCRRVRVCISPSGAKVAVGVREGGGELLVVAIERRCKTLEGNTKLPIQSLKHRHRQRPLQSRTLVGTAAEHHLRTHEGVIQSLVRTESDWWAGHQLT